jgi:hypothetical protein
MYEALISSFDFAELPEFCQSITSSTDFVLYREKTSVSSHSGAIAVLWRGVDDIDLQAI